MGLQADQPLELHHGDDPREHNTVTDFMSSFQCLTKEMLEILLTMLYQGALRRIQNTPKIVAEVLKHCGGHPTS